MKQSIYAGACRMAIFLCCLLCGSRIAAQSGSPASSQSSLTILSGQKIIMQLETPMHSRTTKKGQRVEFTTAGDVYVENQVVIPTKSLIRGTVTRAKRAGRLFGRAEIQLRFDEVTLADGAVVPLKATITRVGFDPVDSAEGGNPKIKGESGGAGGDARTIASTSAQGAIIGVVSGGLRGATYGAAAGAAIAITQAALRRGSDVDLPRSTMFEARFDVPMSIPEKAVAAAQKPAPPPDGRQERAGSAIPDPKVAEAAPAASAESNADEGTITATRPVLKRRTPPAEEAAPADSTAAHKSGVPAEPPEKPSSENPSRVAAEARTAGTIPTISVNVRMVQVDAVVRDRSGRMMDRLQREDFRVYEDNVSQQIQTFSRDELPVAAALVVDRSGSVGPYISELRRIAARALNQLKPGDEVCLFSFAADVERLEDLTPDRGKIANALNRIHPGGQTDISGALYEAVKYLSRSAPGRRHAVILISDNQQTVDSKASDSEVIKMALEGETVVYSLKTSGASFQLGGQIPSILSGGGAIGKITQETGGEVIKVGGVASLDSALNAVISRLRMRYSFGYYPSGTAQGGAFHEIRVRLDDHYGKAGSDYFIHAKRGYYATGNSLSSSADRVEIAE